MDDSLSYLPPGSLVAHFTVDPDLGLVCQNVPLNAEQAATWDGPRVDSLPEFDERLHRALLEARPYHIADSHTHKLTTDTAGTAWPLCAQPTAKRLHVDWRAVDCAACRSQAELRYPDESPRG